MGVERVVLDFMRWITLGTVAVLGIIVFISLRIPRRKTVSQQRYLPEKHR
jgi:hypothetical protein